MNKLLQRVKVVMTAAPTYLVAASTIITIVADDVADVLPSSVNEAVAAGAVKAVGVLAAAISIIRRSTPVIFPQRGLLPPSGPVIPSANEKR